MRLGGFTHPLFADPAYAARTPFGRRPLPGPALLLLAGGLVEQSGRIDDTVIALVGFDEVRFLNPAFPGDEIFVEVEVVGKEPRSEGRRGLLAMRWRAKVSGQMGAEAHAKMLFRRV